MFVAKNRVYKVAPDFYFWSAPAGGSLRIFDQAEQGRPAMIQSESFCLAETLGHKMRNFVDFFQCLKGYSNSRCLATVASALSSCTKNGTCQKRTNFARKNC
jgi:hypothetical protein